DLLDEFLNLRLIAVELLLGVSRGGEIGVAGVTRSLRIGENHVHVIAGKIIPVLDTLGVAGAHEEGREGVERRGIVRKILLPVAGIELLVRQRLDLGYLVDAAPSRCYETD